MNIPNLISLGRLFCAPLMVWFIISQRYSHAFWLFCLAGLSDLVDGLLARILKDTTTIGRYLDPIADKALIVSVIISLGIQGSIPLWFTIIVVFRDVLILGGILIYLVIDYTIEIKPLLISKVNTFLQILTVATVLFEKMFYNEFSLAYTNEYDLNSILFIITASTTILSGMLYVYHGIKGLNACSK